MGFLEGRRIGWVEGCEDGWFVGDRDGWFVGDRDGWFVGDRDGEYVSRNWTVVAGKAVGATYVTDLARSGHSVNGNDSEPKYKLTLE